MHKYFVYSETRTICSVDYISSLHGKLLNRPKTPRHVAASCLIAPPLFIAPAKGTFDVSCCLPDRKEEHHKTEERAALTHLLSQRRDAVVWLWHGVYKTTYNGDIKQEYGNFILHVLAEWNPPHCDNVKVQK